MMHNRAPRHLCLMMWKVKFGASHNDYEIIFVQNEVLIMLVYIRVNIEREPTLRSL